MMYNHAKMVNDGHFTRTMVTWVRPTRSDAPLLTHALPLPLSFPRLPVASARRAQHRRCVVESRTNCWNIACAATMCTGDDCMHQLIVERRFRWLPRLNAAGMSEAELKRATTGASSAAASCAHHAALLLGTVLVLYAVIVRVKSTRRIEPTDDDVVPTGPRTTAVTNVGSWTRRATATRAVDGSDARPMRPRSRRS